MNKIIMIIAALMLLTVGVAQAAATPNMCEVYNNDDEIVNMMQTNIICAKSNTIDQNLEGRYGDLRHVIGSVNLGVGVESTKSMQTFCNTITDSISLPTAYVGRAILYITGKAIKQVWHAKDKNYTVKNGVMDITDRVYDATHGTGMFSSKLPQYAFMTTFFDLMQSAKENHRPLPEDFKQLIAAYIRASRQAAVKVLTKEFAAAGKIQDACANDPDILCRDITKAAHDGEKANFDKGISACLDGIRFEKDGFLLADTFDGLRQQGVKFLNAGGIAYNGKKDYKRAAEYYAEAAAAYELIPREDVSIIDEMEAVYGSLFTATREREDDKDNLMEKEVAERYWKFAISIPNKFDPSWSVYAKAEAQKFKSLAYADSSEWAESDAALREAYSILAQYKGKDDSIEQLKANIDKQRDNLKHDKAADVCLDSTKEVEAQNPDEVIEACKEGADYRHSQKNSMSEAVMLMSIGEIADTKKDYKTAIDYYLKVVPVLDEAEKNQKKDISTTLTRLLSELGNAYYRTGEYVKTAETYSQAADRAKKIKDEEDRVYWQSSIFYGDSFYASTVVKDQGLSDQALAKAYSILKDCPKCTAARFKTLSGWMDGWKVKLEKQKQEAAKPQEGKQEGKGEQK